MQDTRAEQGREDMWNAVERRASPEEAMQSIWSAQALKPETYLSCSFALGFPEEALQHLSTPAGSAPFSKLASQAAPVVNFETCSTLMEACAKRLT